ncbi:DUF1028 domain-containing protein [Salinarimonas soli]|uniref:DUF1028 domain-containing protein n=1 Tax=Salinarimonas soli TaxID=1638099 RepID=A0A5B2VAH5_9HYPH|nr:DUF1028 domain-containing protein [Salinarimonas soli]KAA2235197.1 DUF1028 domain-containing protein [Salinarimonas soli]
MTWSIIARDPGTGELGIAAASRFFALGARVPFLKPGAGALATQALVNPLYGPDGLGLLAGGMGAREVVNRLVSADEGRESRQLHVMDATGAAAGHTGAECVPWCGWAVGENCSVAGNMLVGPSVVTQTIRTFETRADLPFARRLIAAMAAGEAEGGDKRGRQSAVLIVYSGQDYSDLDLRVDDHADPLAELARLEVVSRDRWAHFRRFLPTRENPAGITDRARIDREIAQAIAAATEGGP